MSDLKTTIRQDMIAAMRAKEKLRLGTVRMLLAAIKQREIDEQIQLDDAAVMAIIVKMIKQRQDSANQYQQANRPELAEQENAEIEILQAYLPTQLSEAEVDVEVQNVIKALGAESMKDMGPVMAALKQKLEGRTDISKVSLKVKTFLT